ncbi:MAG TPA: hypothetical protein VH040_09425 [Usitatibacter sp.]|jgi:hypothetical protein|nr:hypothetical protein [Usitatibacter sp.]
MADRLTIGTEHMGREPRTYSIWATILQRGSNRFEIAVSALAVDALGPEERFEETAVALTQAEAVSLRLEMVKEVCERLQKSGSHVSSVDLRPVELG